MLEQTIARSLVDNVVYCHGIAGELLLDRESNLLSSLIMGVCKLLGMCKINTTAYHPQGDGLVENFNRTLQVMLTKHVKEFVLLETVVRFAFCISCPFVCI